MTTTSTERRTVPVVAGTAKVADETGATRTDGGSDHDPRPVNPSPTRGVEAAFRSLIDRVGVLDQRLQVMDQRQAAMSTELAQLGTESRVLSEMHDQCRALREKFHEREVLLPIFRALIGITDRCRNEATKMRATLNNQERGLDLDVVLALRHLISAREADRIELDALLSNFGVEFYRHEGDRFEPSLQKCVKRVRTSTHDRHQWVAARLLPGYRRDETIVRPECVGVFVHTT